MAVHDNEEYMEILKGTEMVSALTYRYAIFEDVYLKGERSVEGRAKKELEKALKDMYAAILTYLLKVIRFYDQPVAGTLTLLSFPNFEYGDCFADSARSARSEVIGSDQRLPTTYQRYQ